MFLLLPWPFYISLAQSLGFAALYLTYDPKDHRIVGRIECNEIRHKCQNSSNSQSTIVNSHSSQTSIKYPASRIQNPVSSIEPLPQNRIDHLWIGLAPGGLHHLPDKKAQQLGFAAFIGFNFSGITGNNFVDDSLDGT